MKISEYIVHARNMSEARKNMVRKDVAHLINLWENNSPQENVKISAPTCFIIEKCFDKRRGGVKPEDILAVIS